MSDAVITISVKEHERLLKEIDFLEALRAAGVDNWSGYDDALELWREGK